MIQHLKWSLTELDNMIPYERSLYTEMLSQWIEEENKRIEQAQTQR